MTAPPLPAPPSEHSPLKHADSWKPMDVDPVRDHGGPGADLESNGAPRPAEHAVPDGADYASNPSATNGDAGAGDPRADVIQRGEKIIKVLTRSLLCVQFV